MPNTKYRQSLHQLQSLPFLPQMAEGVEFIYSTADYKQHFIQLIRQAKTRIYITALYWQNDEAGQEMLAELYQAKQRNPHLDIQVFVDFHRAQRGLIGAEIQQTNAEWYAEQRQKYALDPQNDIAFHGVPINTRELFGVLHIKGSVFDDTILYSGASINNVYLHQQDKYRYDRYQKIRNRALADSFVAFLNDYLNDQSAVQRLDQPVRKDKSIRPAIRHYRKKLSQHSQYHVSETVEFDPNQLLISPIFGLSNGNQLNTVIEALFSVVQQKLTICTPYFNFPRSLRLQLAQLLKEGKAVEIIVGDKTANDFYVAPDKPFNMSAALPYLYEMNLRNFCKKQQKMLNNGQLTVRLWQHGDNSYHLKGVWVDDHYILLTGNNLNPRAWRLDAENALLIQDPQQQLQPQVQRELQTIRQHTQQLHHYRALEKLHSYPPEVKKLLNRFRRLQADKIVRLVL
ncbi:CDP-diacylglycerol--serine O-phosphatidyltransferase [Testudinibacter sp. TR-2022]|uniref:CDP-diacylglycerol--serine O-phosphatidyltransferase n=1 Tax=Testudinibacter sp. TR-2022 TaxID=2585029 RepID=UPI00111807E0|nr:CDP-diacylglycerol--serine O-phosphatidyltransferase [Testudinibacter sp. TR-2022]TNH09081.1 CDP-diacylglycerol--serine O-phosphatidyltransferase [Pasteurellaceae bacterium Phil11]TNH24017.1 CDP-diacylglycerol--serine O-phosphatidyltransferase [Testudinibacter sp. TR-2022]TNH27175.1 CDP-diacylglycerol--serine O-phosphatidyltransferase [Testudinibacter sp. TR-2022]